MLLKDLAIGLNTLSHKGFVFDVMPLSDDSKGKISVLQVTVEGFDELPIFVSATDEQLLCITNLFHKDEIKAELVNDLNTMLLQLSVNVPLSAFGIVDDTYILFGAMSISTPVDHIAEELVVQAENALESLDALEEFLKD